LRALLFRLAGNSLNPRHHFRARLCLRAAAASVSELL
jgi:hypothetical protein